MLTRRELIAASVAGSVATTLRAQPRRLSIIRRDLATPAGQADLVKYARAVRIMMGLPPGDPRSWSYQWYIHSVPRDRTKESELQRLFGASAPGRALAAETWSTCQSHMPGNNPDHFLPWHRMYLLCFETTIRSLLNDPAFALPYWNYLDPAQRALPAAFRAPSHPLWGALHRPDRNEGTNAGVPIDVGAHGLINGLALESEGYRPIGVRPGFCRHIDGRLHGNVHVRVGNGRGMGDVPWAANDPIFWLHHANIDRLWASWNSNGGRNPQDAAWGQQRFAFPSGTGGRAEFRNAQVTSLEGAGYGYDRLEPGPAIVVPTSAADRPVILLDSRTQPTVVPPGGATVPLRRVSRPRIMAVAGARLFLVVSGLSAPTSPGVVYQVDLRNRGGQWTTAGHINFFEAVEASGGAHAGHGDRQFVFDVTEIAAGMGGRPEVRIQPVGAPDGAVAVTVGRVELVQN